MVTKVSLSYVMKRIIKNYLLEGGNKLYLIERCDWVSTPSRAFVLKASCD